MSMSYAVSQEVNLQVAIWMVAGAIYATAKGAQRLAAYLVSWTPALLIALQVVCKASVLVAVIVGAVVVAASYPALVLCVAAIVVFAMVTKGK